MRKGRDRGEKKIGKKEKNDEKSSHYVIASSRPPERQPLTPHARAKSCWSTDLLSRKILGKNYFCLTKLVK